MKLDQLGQPARCSQCNQLRASDHLMYQGPELEPICLECLEQLDPARAQILKRIQEKRKD